ncbi:hypothetical protein P1J78_22070 [Psychromarinibacter sp. C21-152]|uniref:Uncharacterized protein n=1 Tax=Psychromarinibacter sediminicola TaxID=3033385 RepID=A0AAE3NZ90_9RHOB|nr:hypothetical protein [Psychromarinibacter sediminicola]MDF0603422.1 hypothetical protein [Psychromarinibacter sediminicola]
MILRTVVPHSKVSLGRRCPDKVQSFAAGGRGRRAMGTKVTVLGAGIVPEQEFEAILARAAALAEWRGLCAA